jgi:hypothetical protein
MCVEDENAAALLEHRRDTIRTKMFPDIESCRVLASNCDDLVWVDGSILLRFMSCKDRLLDRLEDEHSILQHQSLFCQHERPGLHPRVARKGKLLPRSVYEAFVVALQEEQEANIGKSIGENAIDDYIVVATSCLVCQQCCEEYRSQLSAKFVRVNAMKQLYEDLDPKGNRSCTLEMGLGETLGNECDKYAYVVARKFIVWFRKVFARLMKQAANALLDAKHLDCDTEIAEQAAMNMAEGLDFLDLSDFEMKPLSTGADEEQKDEGLVLRVNGPVTCKF